MKKLSMASVINLRHKFQVVCFSKNTFHILRQKVNTINLVNTFACLNHLLKCQHFKRERQPIYSSTNCYVCPIMKDGEIPFYLFISAKFVWLCYCCLLVLFIYLCDFLMIWNIWHHQKFICKTIFSQWNF